jgi:hypothetical protein
VQVIVRKSGMDAKVHSYVVKLSSQLRTEVHLVSFSSKAWHTGRAYEVMQTIPQKERAEMRKGSTQVTLFERKFKK